MSEPTIDYEPRHPAGPTVVAELTQEEYRIILEALDVYIAKLKGNKRRAHLPILQAALNKESDETLRLQSLMKHFSHRFSE